MPCSQRWLQRKPGDQRQRQDVEDLKRVEDGRDRKGRAGGEGLLGSENSEEKMALVQGESSSPG